MKKGKLYGVGVGPGDKELITLKAVRILKQCDVAAVPVTAGGEKTAYSIAEEFIKDKEILRCTIEMTRDKKSIMQSYLKAAEDIEILLSLGKSVAFITLGDPTIYSTYMQIDALIRDKGYETEIVSGVTSFCAAAAKLKISLCERDDALVIIPAFSKDLKNCLDLKAGLVLMKASGHVDDVAKLLKKENRLNDAKMIECCGMKNEKIYEDIDQAKDNLSYFSTIIVKR